jgi:hypothetical protein
MAVQQHELDAESAAVTQRRRVEKLCDAPAAFHRLSGVRDLAAAVANQHCVFGQNRLLTVAYCHGWDNA